MAVFVMQFPIACFVVSRLENIYAHKKTRSNNNILLPILIHAMIPLRERQQRTIFYVRHQT